MYISKNSIRYRYLMYRSFRAGSASETRGCEGVEGKARSTRYFDISKLSIPFPYLIVHRSFRSISAQKTHGGCQGTEGKTGSIGYIESSILATISSHELVSTFEAHDIEKSETSIPYPTLRSMSTSAPTGRVERNWTESGGKAPQPGFLLVGELAQVPHYPTLPGDEGVPGWLSPPRLIFRDQVGSTMITRQVATARAAVATGVLG